MGLVWGDDSRAQRRRGARALARVPGPTNRPCGQGVAAAAAPDEESVEAEAGQQAPPLPPVHARASAP